MKIKIIVIIVVTIKIIILMIIIITMIMKIWEYIESRKGHYNVICWNFHANVDVLDQYTNRCQIYITIVKIKQSHLL